MSLIGDSFTKRSQIALQFINTILKDFSTFSGQYFESLAGVLIIITFESGRKNNIVDFLCTLEPHYNIGFE